MRNNTQFEIYQYIQAKAAKKIRGAHTISFFDPNKKMQKGQAVIVPNMASFIRDVTEHGNIGALKKRVLRLSFFQLIQLALWNKTNVIKLAKKDFSMGVTLLTQIELLQIMKYNPSRVILSDQIVDLSIALKNAEIIRAFLATVQKHLHINAGIMTNNVVSLLHFVSNHHIKPVDLFFPCNPSGYEMNPSQENVEKYLQMLPSKNTLVAMVPKDDAQTRAYLKKMKISKILVGWL